ncbi:MAG: endospore germination permease [Clostridia bacterium]|nr:endospore germination permease [Clostridia bacterium]
MIREKIGPVQAGLLAFNRVFGTAILFLPDFVVASARQDAWISGLLATAGGAGFAWFYCTLALRFPGRNLIEILRLTFGRWLGDALGWIFVSWWILTIAVIIRKFVEFQLLAALRFTPIVVVDASFLLVAWYAVRAGLEVIARLETMIFPLSALATLGIAVLIAQQLDLSYLTPILEYGWLPVFQGAMYHLAWMGEATMALVLWMPYNSDPVRARRWIAGGTAFAGLSTTLLTALPVALFGPEFTKQLVIPVYSVVQAINVSDFLTNADPVFVVFWSLENFTRVAQGYLAANLLLTALLGLRSYRPTSSALGAFLCAFSIWAWSNVSEVLTFLSNVWVPMTLVFAGSGLPLLTWVLAVMRGLRPRPKNEETVTEAAEGYPLFRG